MTAGDAWGTAEELLHPRDSHGRFRSKWKMSKAAFQRTMSALSSFSPKTFQNDEEAGVHVQRLARGRNVAVDKYLANSAEINKRLRAGEDVPEAKALDGAMKPLADDLILSRVVGPEAFGLKPDNIANLEEYTGKLVADKGFGSANIGTPLASTSPSITMVIAAPKGTRVAVPRSQGSREVLLDREQPLRITKVTPDGKGGFYVMAVAMPKGTAGNIRTKKLGTRAPKPTEPTPEPGNVPAPAPGVPAPSAPQAPVRTGKPGRPAAPPPPPRTDGHVVDSIGNPAPGEAEASEAGSPKVSDAVQKPSPEPTPKVVPTDRSAPAEKPTPEPKKVEEISTGEAERLQKEQDRRVRAEVRAARAEGREEERKRAEIAARREQTKKNKEFQDKEEERRKQRLMALLTPIGETKIPEDPMLQAFIGIKMSQLESKKASKKKTVADLREAAANQKSESAKRILEKLADSVEGKKIESADLTGPRGRIANDVTDAVKRLKGIDRWTSITDLRNELGEKYNRKDVDQALKDMIQRPDVRINPIQNSKALSESDREAALRVGGEDTHIIMIKGSAKDRAADVKALNNPAEVQKYFEQRNLTHDEFVDLVKELNPDAQIPANSFRGDLVRLASEAVFPVKKKPGLATGKTNASRVNIGDRVIVKKNVTGNWEASKTKTGGTTITVTKKQPISYKGRGSVRITGTDESGNEITVVDGPGIQTYWLADLTAAGRKAKEK